jgi:thiamine kinase-like enzyme
MKGGFINRMFLCHNQLSNERILLRLYGNRDEEETNIMRKIGSRDAEVLINYLMDINEIGPKLLGIFDGGRIEQFLDGYETPTDDHLKHPEIMACIAKKLVKVHSLQIPLDKKPTDLIRKTRLNLTKYWGDYRKGMLEIPLTEDLKTEANEVDRIADDFQGMIDWYEELQPRVRSKSVFSHSDLNRGNIMINDRKGGDDRVVLIDFEFAAYNHRGCDIGHFFRRSRWDPKIFAEGWSVGIEKQTDYPSEEVRRHFIHFYLEEINRNINTTDCIDTENHLLLESEFFGGLYGLFLLSHMLTVAEMIDNRKVHPLAIVKSFVEDFHDRKKRVRELLLLNKV